jgi:hypothetical protein
MSAQGTDRDGRSWMTCLSLRIRRLGGSIPSERAYVPASQGPYLDLSSAHESASRGRFVSHICHVPPKMPLSAAAARPGVGVGRHITATVAAPGGPDMVLRDRAGRLGPESRPRHDRTGHGWGHRAMRSRTTWRHTSQPASGIGMPKLWAYTSSRGTTVASTS